jgi:hypothetical protein
MGLLRSTEPGTRSEAARLASLLLRAKASSRGTEGAQFDPLLPSALSQRFPTEDEERQVLGALLDAARSTRAGRNVEESDIAVFGAFRRVQAWLGWPAVMEILSLHRERLTEFEVQQLIDALAGYLDLPSNHPRRRDLEAVVRDNDLKALTDIVTNLRGAIDAGGVLAKLESLLTSVVHNTWGANGRPRQLRPGLEKSISAAEESHQSKETSGIPSCSEEIRVLLTQLRETDERVARDAASTLAIFLEFQNSPAAFAMPDDYLKVLPAPLQECEITADEEREVAIDLFDAAKWVIYEHRERTAATIIWALGKTNASVGCRPILELLAEHSRLTEDEVHQAVHALDAYLALDPLHSRYPDVLRAVKQRDDRPVLELVSAGSPSWNNQCMTVDAKRALVKLNSLISSSADDPGGHPTE